MREADRVYLVNRNAGRREEDRQLLDQIFRHSQVSQVGQIIMSEMNLENLFGLIMAQTVQILGVQRCTVFLYDDQSDQLWSIGATGIVKNKIRISSNLGIAGWVFKHKEPLIIDDAYNDPRFFPGIDKETGFLTRNILCIPLINRSDVCIGVLQALNKIDGDFTHKDKDLLISISHYISIAFENSKLYEDLKSVNEARKKVIDHLAHEIRTPVAIVDAAMESISRKLANGETQNLDIAIARCRRNLKRLLSLQEKITDILNYRFSEDKQKLSHLIETFFSFTEELSEDSQFPYEVIFEKILKRLESIYRIEEFHPAEVNLNEFLNGVCNHAIEAMGNRDVEIIRNFEPELLLNTDSRMLNKVCSGLLKNAIEATPDEGRIRVGTKKSDDGITISFRDWGVGITPDNQKNIFSGFFHTQNSDYYASKKPYAFYAGGSGSDLLRTKVFSERYGFHVNFTSKCCQYIPGVKNMCPGRISRCSHIDHFSECFDSGGSTFTIRFP